MYQQLAVIYDDCYTYDAPEQLLQATADYFSREHFSPPGTLLDIGCGTGTLTIELAKWGWQLFGIDISPSMLEIARQKVLPDEIKSRITWQCQDMKNLALPVSMDLAVSYCNVFNHLESRIELGQTFNAVYNALKPQGRFFFVMDSEAAFEHCWNKGKVIRSSPHGPVFKNSAFNPVTRQSIVSAQIEFTNNGVTQILSDSIRLTCFSETDIRHCLMEQGFIDIRCQPISIESGPFTLLCWEARRPTN